MTPETHAARLARITESQLLAAARNFDVTDAQWHRVVSFHRLACPVDLSTLDAEERS